ncbi:MAG: formate dehydrogenase subunit alpha, partial [Gammaproteobacteria bacterium]
MLRITIDGEEFEVPEGMPLLQALQESGHDVPHLCHDDRLQVHGGCRLCAVTVDGEPRPVASCSTPVRDGMVVSTHTPALQALRQTNLSLLARHYPAASVAKEPMHPFHRLLADHQVTAGDLSRTEKYCDDTHPYLAIDMDRCIQCERCVRICDEVQGQSIWQTWGRGEETHIATHDHQSLLDSGCVSCGACADTCPTGAITDKRTGAVEKWTRSTCVYCGVGCQMDVGTTGDRVVAVRPAPDSPVNRGHLCVKGRYAFEFTHAKDRITSPLLRDGDDWRAVSWDEALDHVAGKLKDILAQHGGEAIGVLGSARATNEENYLAQKFARVVLGSNNVDCCARVCHQPSAKALKTMLGTGAATNAFDDIERAHTFLICGANPTENHPVVGARIKQAVRKGARLIVVDPRRIELADYADVWLPVRPGHNVELFNAMAFTIIEEGLVDTGFLARRVDGFDAYRALIADYAPEKVAARCGVPATDIRAAARLYGSRKPAMCFHGLGMTEHTQGTEGVMTLINLALLTGNLGKPGSGVNPLRGQNNVQGSAQMGCEPATLTGAQDLHNAEVRQRFESRWQTPLPPKPGLDLPGMIDAAASGRLKALWAFGYDIALTLPNKQRTDAALANVDMVIVQDLFLNETARVCGTVFLPAASVFERDGTFMNSDRRVQRVRAAIPAPGDARPDWWIIQQIAQRMSHGNGFAFDSAGAIWDEVRALWPAGAGLSYARPEHESLNWPCPDEHHPGTPVLHREGFAHAERTVLACIPFVPTREQCDADFPLLLTTGRTLHHFNAGTMTYRTPNRLLRPS